MSATKEHYHELIERETRKEEAPTTPPPTGGEGREYPILFSTPMVQAILEGRKTQTRRICKHQHWSHSELTDVNVNGISQKADRSVSCPYGKPGDLLWVRETWASVKFANKEVFGYKSLEKYPSQIKYKPSIHMPKAAARIWLEITEVKVERVQYISEEDAKAEGCERLPILWSRKDTFKDLWQSINGTESWRANPWVWVVKFKVLSTTGKPSFDYAQEDKTAVTLSVVEGQQQLINNH